VESGSAKYPREFRELAIRMVRDERERSPSESAAIVIVSRKLGIGNPEALRKWVIQADYDDSAHLPDSSWRKFAKKSFFRSHPVIIGVAIAIFGALGVSYSQNWLGLDRSQPDLQVDQVTLTSPAISPSSTGKTITPFTVDIKLLNTGTQLVAINNARLVIQQFAVIPQCASQGGFASTGSYSANMPTSPQQGAVVNIPISQIVDADGADRFELQLRTPIKIGDNPLGKIYLYRINVYLEYNSDERSIDAGEVLVTLPLELTDGNGYFWSHEVASQQAALQSEYGSGTSSLKQCLITNSRNINAILSLPASRTLDAAALRSEIAY
jgi:hypothetical protein